MIGNEVLQTKRLVLVPINAAYATAINQTFTSQVNVYMFPALPKSLQETHEVIARFVDGRMNQKEAVYAITLAGDGSFLGLVGLHQLQSGCPELGIWLKSSAHGHHYGREAIGALMDVAKQHGWSQVCYPVDRRNIASKKIALYYGGTQSGAMELVSNEEGRVLEVETYLIALPADVLK